MATGFVKTIDSSNTSGTVELDMDGGTFPFSDPNFPSLGLSVNSLCSFDIDFFQLDPVATNLQPLVMSEVIIDTVITGDLSVNEGEEYKIKDGGRVTGNIIVNKGKVTVSRDGSAGGIIIDGEGNAKVRRSGIVTGNIIVNNGSVFSVVNGGTVTGDIIVNKGNRLRIGNNSGGGNITGNIDVKKIRKVSITTDSSINCTV